MKPVLDGYQFFERIGSGTSGKVYRAMNTYTHEICAIKVMSCENLSPRMKTCLHREITILNSLSHSNIVRLLDAVSTSKEIFLIFEYCNGGDLLTYLKINGRLSEPFARRIIQQLVSAMSELNDFSLIHRDIKLANVFLNFTANSQ